MPGFLTWAPYNTIFLIESFIINILNYTPEYSTAMAQNVSILPHCIQPAAIQGIAAVECQDLSCACHSFKFLNALEQSLLVSCDDSGIALALESARRYCTKANPGLASDRSADIAATVVTFTILAIASVILRVWSRRLAHVRLGWDDWFIFCGLVSTLGCNALLLAGIAVGEGRHPFMVDPYIAALSVKYSIPLIWLAAGSIVFVRFSIFALYLRIFSTLRRFRQVCYASEVFVLIYALTIVLVYTLSCRPVSYFWDKTIQNGHCLDHLKILAASAAIDTATGIWALILPIPILVGLHTTLRHKAVLIAVFGVGAFACVTAVIRVPFLPGIDFNDAGYSLVPFTLWTAVELNMGVVSVCLPTMAPLFQGFLPRLFSSMRSKSGRQSHSRLEDEARIYAGDNTKGANRTETQITTAGVKWKGERNEGSKDGDGEVWPMNVIGVTTEVDVERDTSLSSKQRFEQT